MICRVSFDALRSDPLEEYITTASVSPECLAAVVRGIVWKEKRLWGLLFFVGQNHELRCHPDDIEALIKIRESGVS